MCCGSQHLTTKVCGYESLRSQDDTFIEASTYATSPCIGFTAALSGNTLSVSTRSASPN